MSMHKIPLTPLEKAGLEAHRLEIGTPSVLSDVFRHGVAWACQNGETSALEARIKELEGDIAWHEGVLSTIERYAVHHQNLSLIQHFPPIKKITKSYADGVAPKTDDPFERIKELESQLEQAMTSSKLFDYLDKWNLEVGYETGRRGAPKGWAVSDIRGNFLSAGHPNIRAAIQASTQRPDSDCMKIKWTD